MSRSIVHIDIASNGIDDFLPFIKVLRKSDIISSIHIGNINENKNRISIP